MLVKIDKLTMNKNTFLTELPLTGNAPYEPQLEKSFIVFDLNYPNSKTQGLHTSTVKEIEETNTGWILKTLNNEYKVDRVDEQV